MIPNIHQSIQDVILAAPPEARILWQQIRLITGENAALRQLYFAGTLTASEYLVYSANRIYVIYEMALSVAQGAATLNTLTIYNESNVAVYVCGNNSAYWDGTAAAVRYANNTFELHNFYFSRVAYAGNYSNVIMKGYRIIF